MISLTIRGKKKLLTDVGGGSGVSDSDAREAAIRRHHSHNEFIFATRQKVVNGQTVVPTASDILALLDGVHTVVPAHFEATRTPIVLIFTPAHLDAVRSVGRDSDGGRRQRLWTGGAYCQV